MNGDHGLQLKRESCGREIIGEESRASPIDAAK